jgi:hypothetical protein
MLVPFFPGNGERVMLEVSYLADYPRGTDGTCAFCHGDPCGERSAPDTDIMKYWAENTWAETCPMCDGRPT